MAERGKRHEIDISPSVSGRLERTGCHFFLSLFLFLLDRKAKSEGNYFMPLLPLAFCSPANKQERQRQTTRLGGQQLLEEEWALLLFKGRGWNLFLFIVFLRSTIDEPSGGRNFARLGRLAETNNKSETKDKWWPTRGKKRHRCE